MSTPSHPTGQRGVKVYPTARPGALVRFGATATAAGAVLIGKLLVAAGLRRRPEGWRRTVGILLRGEATRFALSAFGLKLPADPAGAAEARVADALLAFLADEPDAHFYLDWRRPVTIRYPLPSVDLAVLRFDGSGALAALEPRLVDPAASPREAIASRVHDTIVRTYNRTLELPEVQRAQQLLAAVRSTFAAETDARRYAERVMKAACLSFETLDLTDPGQRFAPPAFASRRSLGGGYLSWIARIDERRGTVDLWVSAHHVGLDGVPLQDMLNRLERTWGTGQSPVFPDAAIGGPFTGPEPCHGPGERPVHQLVTFVDLSPVVRLRRQLNAEHAGAIGGDVTLGALLAWLLTLEPEFHGVRVASTVDVSASSGYQRDVDVVSLRPDDYRPNRVGWTGLVEFAREFNRILAAARERRSPVRAGMQTAGLIPAWAHAVAVRSNPAALDETFGTLCVTIIRDARVFIAPMTDLGLGHGFFAIGSVNLPAASGGVVTAVSIKGDAGRVERYPEILQRAIDRAAGLVSG